MTTKTSLYKAALRELGERSIASLSDTGPGKLALDDVYDDAVIYCLEEGDWHDFACRTISLEHSTDVSPVFGFNYAFEKPTDYVRTVQLGFDGFTEIPLEDYDDDSGFWYSNVDPIFVKYVSSDPSYGLELANWPKAFAFFVSTYLAMLVCTSLGGSDALRDRLEKSFKERGRDARSKDAWGQRTRILPAGSWTRARGGRWWGNTQRRQD